MAYQDIVNKIRASAESVNSGGTFINARRQDGSIEYESPFPQIHNYNPFKTTIDRVKNMDASNLLMGFWFEDKPDSSNDEREAIIEQADALFRAFLDDLEADSVMVTNLVSEQNYRTLSGTLSGIIIQFTATYKNNVCD